MHRLIANITTKLNRSTDTMNIEKIREDIADELGAVHEIISNILDSIPDDEPEHKAIRCNDNALALLQYARGYADRAFKCLDKLY
jgi:DNA-directed RNA polymerase subunit F